MPFYEKLWDSFCNPRCFRNLLFHGRWSKRERLPYGADFARHMRDIRALHIRDDDLYLATYPKCGTHWAWEIMVMLQKGTADYDTKTKENVFLDFRQASVIDEKPSPRILNCHFPCKLTPRGIIEKGIKIVHVMRNPKDAFVSMYYHQKAMNTEYYVQDFKSFLPYGRGDYGVYFFTSFFDYIRGWEHFTEEHPDQILNLFYEDLKEDPIREIKKINVFLGTNRDDQLIEQIAEACDFHKLKKADAEVKVKEETMKKLPDFMYRKGEVGDWKNHFTVSMNEQMDEWIEENSRDCKTKFRYTI